MIDKRNKLTEAIIEVWTNGGRVEHEGIHLVVEKTDGELFVKRKARLLLSIVGDKAVLHDTTLTENEAIAHALTEIGLACNVPMHPEVDVASMVRESVG